MEGHNAVLFFFFVPPFWGHEKVREVRESQRKRENKPTERAGEKKTERAEMTSGCVIAIASACVYAVPLAVATGVEVFFFARRWRWSATDLAPKTGYPRDPLFEGGPRSACK